MARVALVACFLFSADALRLETVLDRRTLTRVLAGAPLAGLAQAANAERVSNAAMDGTKSAPWRDSAASNVALGAGGGAPRPTFKAFDASLEGKIGLQDGKRVDDSGSMYKAESLTGSPGEAAALGSRKGGNIPTIRLAGAWADPNHPGCVRKIQLAGNKAFLKSADEDGKPWKAVGLIAENSVTFDFSAKGGPTDVTATFVVGKGLVFPDGNVWTKM